MQNHAKQCKESTLDRTLLDWKILCNLLRRCGSFFSETWRLWRSDTCTLQVWHYNLHAKVLSQYFQNNFTLSILLFS